MRPADIAALMGLGQIEDRVQVLADLWTPPSLPPHIGGHAYIHPTALCPVACRHCMYGSNLDHEGKFRLSRADIDGLKRTLDDIQPAKLTISGGGEPFLELQLCREIISKVSCRRIELVTAAHWARSVLRAKTTLAKIADAVRADQLVNIRVSVDSFHWDAPNPVGFGNYTSLVAAFSDPTFPTQVVLSFRGLLRERALIEHRFEHEAGAQIEQIDEWNSRLKFPGLLQASITYNVMRFSGAAAENGIERKKNDIGAIDYFEQYAKLDGIHVATALNDASVGAYPNGMGLAFTFDSDGSYFIFGATPPDWRGNLCRRLEENLHLFSLDPITQYALHHGPIAAVRLLGLINPERAKEALASEDIASFIPDAFCDPFETGAARILAIAALVSEGKAAWHGNSPLPIDGVQALALVGGATA